MPRSGTPVASSAGLTPQRETMNGLGNSRNIRGGGVLVREKPARQEAGIARLVTCYAHTKRARGANRSSCSFRLPPSRSLL